MTTSPELFGDGGSPDAATGEAVREVTIENFEATLEESTRRLVVFDFWAGWCQPCRMIGPVLEAIANESNGSVLLAKVDTDREQQLAAAFGVQSLPTVIAFRDKKPIDQFQGALPEGQLRGWFDRLLPSRADELVAEAASADDAATAVRLLREALENEESHEQATYALVRHLIEEKQFEEARERLEQRRRSFGRLEPDGEQLLADLELQASTESTDLQAARDAVAAAPDDLSLQIALAEALAADGRNEQALETALAVVRRDFGEHRDAAKQLMVQIFSRLQSGPLVDDYRRKLTALIY